MRISQGGQGELAIRRERGDPAFYRDSTLMTHIVRELRECYKLPVVRKDAGKDPGNMTFEGNFYVRERGRDWRYAWHFSPSMVRPAYRDYNASREALSGALYLQPLGDVPTLAP